MFGSKTRHEDNSGYDLFIDDGTAHIGILQGLFFHS